MQCILCEKPSAAKNYALALGGRSGTFNGQQYIIVNSVGHIFGMIQDMDKQVKDEALAEKYTKWNIENLPWHQEDLKFKRALKPDMKKVYTDIRDVAVKCDEIVIATDNDPTGEGELLAWEIIEAMNLKGKKYYRSFHVDESKKEIQKAMMNLKYLGTDSSNDPDYKKATFRSKWDFMSMQFTRVFTKLGDGRSVLRQGRLKSYMVWAVGEQIRKASSYEKIPYYTNKFRDENNNVYSSDKEPQFEKQEDVDTRKYHGSDVVVDSKTIKYGSPASLYDLSLLSSSLAPLGFPSKLVLDTYQRMYEDRNSDGEAIVSYPRTEDKTITPEQFNDFLKIADRVADLVGVDKSLLTHRTPRKTHVSASGSHGANRPTGNVPKSLAELESKYGKCGVMIYKFLARNALAMLCEDYKYEHQVGHLKDYPDFKGQVNIPIDLGYKKIFDDAKSNDTGTENASDESTGTNKGPQPLGEFAEPFVFEGFPPKPSMPTAKWLANLLKKNDVGTGATRTSIYADVTNSEAKYPLLVDKRGKITMTPYGEMSYHLLKGTHIGDVKLTEQLQEQMRQVAKGADPNKYLDEMEQLVLDDIKQVEQNAKDAGFTKLAATASSNAVDGYTCPKCKAKIIKGKNYYFCENYKNSGCGFIIKKEFNGAKVSENDVKTLASGKATRELKMYSEAKQKEYKARLKYDGEQKKVIMTFGATGTVAGKAGATNTTTSNDEPTVFMEGCGICKNGTGKVWKRAGQFGTYYKCDKCGATVSETYCGNKFSKEDIEDLFMGDTVKGKFISKRKKSFMADVHIEDGKLKMEFEQA